MNEAEMQRLIRSGYRFDFDGRLVLPPKIRKCEKCGASYYDVAPHTGRCGNCEDSPTEAVHP